MIKLTNNLEQLSEYLTKQGWLHSQEVLERAEKPGEGNMNFTLRLFTNQRSIIIKQSREYVEKYPQVEAPKERALMEASFYELTSERPKLKAQMPGVIAVDQKNSVILMQDLGEGTDFTFIYQDGKSIAEPNLMELMDFAAALHNSFDIEKVENPIRNRAMRKLNHEHIFLYPYMENNGINLNDIVPGLADVAKPLVKNEVLKKRVRELGEVYLSDGRQLLHGDYFPGSWLRTEEGIKVIDPEFCFFGHSEFEIGVTKAHLEMADQSEALIEKAVSRYNSLAKMDLGLMEKFSAIEVLRRIMGLAQLPLEIDLTKRKNLLEKARHILLK